ncbi:hypothetical protein LIER_14190 [Lithospermum erythrorhizon]|uniref:Uncharacterized protein n=1 Tax=Lithospermum erythrorhizon TaxID=34254 RepID=A0AAV3Q2E2_LITER
MANCSNKIWIFWSSELEVEVIEDNIQYVHLKIASPLCAQKIMLTAVYAACKIPARRQLWTGLESMSDTQLPWIVMGDFNTISRQSEQVNKWAAMEDFNDCLLNCKLEDAGFLGSTFSWTNARRSKKVG